MGIYDNIFWKVIFKMNPDHETGVVNWEEKGIRRWVFATIFIPLFGGMYFLGFPQLRYYTFILVMTFFLYMKISRIAPYVLDRTEEFDISFEPTYAERDVIDTMLGYLETSESFTVEKKHR